MNVIFLSRREGKARQLNLARPRTLGIVAGVTLSVLGAAFVMGMELGRGRNSAAGLAENERFHSVLVQQKQEIAALRQQLQLRVDAMAMRLGEMNAHVIRLDALGKDRKSTRLNSSHVEISYAVFCLKKKKNVQVKGFVLDDPKRN